MASKTPVGFIGLGNMGSRMAKNLLKNGYPIIATDLFPESCKELQDIGAQVTFKQKHSKDYANLSLSQTILVYLPYSVRCKSPSEDVQA